METRAGARAWGPVSNQAHGAGRVLSAIPRLAGRGQSGSEDEKILPKWVPFVYGNASFRHATDGNYD
jgi:hypothetical protein